MRSEAKKDREEKRAVDDVFIVLFLRVFVGKVRTP